MSDRSESGFAEQKGESQLAESTVVGNPELPRIEKKIQNADEHAYSRQDSYGKIGINQLVQIMKKKSAVVGLDSSFAFGPVLEQGQRAGPGEQLRKDSPNQ